MTEEQLQILRVAASVASVLVSLVAIFIALRAEKRSSSRFEKQLELQEKIAKANLTPLLASYTSEYPDRKGIIFTNSGSGTAVITEIEFIRGERKGKSIPEVVAGIPWDTYWSFPKTKQYLKAGETIQLAMITAESLANREYSVERRREFIKRFNTDMDSLTIRAVYQDLLGNIQPEYSYTFSFKNNA